MIHQHLEQCFYISKPHRQPVDLDLQLEQIKNSQVQIRAETQQQHEDEQIQHQVNNRHSGEFDRIFKMITQKRAPSASVKTRLKSKKNNSSTKDGQMKYQSEFQQFFQGYNFPEQQNFRRTRKKQTTKKWYLKHNTTKTITEPEQDLKKKKQEEDELEERRIRKLEKQLTYHRRMKQKISNKMDGIADHQQNVLRKTQMLDRDKCNSASKVLWIKAQVSKPMPKMRLIRSGLPVKLSDLDAKVKATGRAHLQNMKAKKDKTFYKVLQKNCDVVMAQIDNYLQLNNQKKKTKNRPSTSKAHPNYLKQTCSATMKKGKLVEKVRKSMDDGDFSKWRQKCIELQNNFNHSRKSSRQINGGLKVFEGYCRLVDQKWSSSQHRLTTMATKGTNHQIEMESYNF